MDIESWNTMYEGLYLSMRLLLQVIVLLTIFLAGTGFVVYLLGLAWFCLEERLKPTRRRRQPVPKAGELGLPHLSGFLPPTSTNSINSINSTTSTG